MVTRILSEIHLVYKAAAILNVVWLALLFLVVVPATNFSDLSILEAAALFSLLLAPILSAFAYSREQGSIKPKHLGFLVIPPNIISIILVLSNFFLQNFVTDSHPIAFAVMQTLIVQFILFILLFFAMINCVVFLVENHRH